MSTTQHYDRLLNQHYLSLTPQQLERKKEDIRLCLVLVRLTRLKLGALLKEKLLTSDVEAATVAVQGTLKSYDMKLQAKHPEKEKQAISKELHKEEKFYSICNLIEYAFGLSNDTRPGIENLTEAVEELMSQFVTKLQSNEGIDLNKYIQLIRFIRIELMKEASGKPSCVSCEGSVIQFTTDVNKPL